MNTDEPFFDPEDPALTAYALGELTDPAARAAIEQTLERSPGARAVLREIRAFTTLLAAEYEQERLLVAAPPANVVTMTPVPGMGRSWPRRLLLAAAMLLLVAVVVETVRGPRWNALVHRPGAVFAITGSLGPAKTRKVEPRPVAHATPPPASAGHADRVSGLAVANATPMVAAQDDDIFLKNTAPAPPDGSSTAAAPPAAPASSFAMNVAPALSAFDAEAGNIRDHGTSAALAALAPVYQSARPAESDKKTLAMGTTDAIDRSSAGPRPENPGRATPDQSKTLTIAGTNTYSGSVTVTAGTRALSSDYRYESRASVPGFASDKSDRGETRRPSVQEEAAAQPSDGSDTAVYEHRAENSFLAAKDSPLSTFSIDVDTASYANVRRFIESGRLPPPDAVRIEELINYFPYQYAPPAPEDEQHPFAVHLEAAACPWNPQDRLVRIGIKGRELARDKRPPSNLVFLLDVSGSMEPPERLPLIKASMRLLVEQLGEDDRVAIVTYAGESGVALPSTTGDHKERILRVLDALRAGGSTNGASGIKLAYRVAREGFIKGGTNRVILATDGDFNVGVTGQGDLVRLIETEAKSGVSLSALGVGTDNYKDATMQKLADKGNGNYAYIDRLDEARKVLVEQMSGTLVTIAKDVKIQVEFNPATVAAYRLIGYEKRTLRKEDFNDDRVDAGEIGAGHGVTALYEVVPVGQSVPQTSPAVDALRYGNPAPAPRVDPTMAVRPEAAAASPRELLTVKMRHKAPDGDKSERSYEQSLTDHGTPDDFAHASPDFKFAAAVASFGLVLRDSPYKGSATLGAAIELAQDNQGADPGEYRAGFIELMRRAQAIKDVNGE